MKHLIQFVEPERMVTPLKVGAVAMPGFAFLEHYFFNDWEFLAFLCILVLIDTFTGVWKAIKFHQVSSSAFGRFFEKIVIYGVALVVIHGLNAFPKPEATRPIFAWIEHLGYAAFMVRETISIFENIGAIRPQLIPPFILKRLKNFDETGNFDPNNSGGDNGPAS